MLPLLLLQCITDIFFLASEDTTRTSLVILLFFASWSPEHCCQLLPPVSSLKALKAPVFPVKLRYLVTGHISFILWANAQNTHHLATLIFRFLPFLYTSLLQATFSIDHSIDGAVCYRLSNHLHFHFHFTYSNTLHSILYLEMLCFMSYKSNFR